MSRRGVIILFGLLAFAGVCVAALLSTYEGRLWSGLPGIENDLEAEVADTLAADFGISGADIDASGQNIEVRFADGAPADSAAVITALEAIDGVRNVELLDGAAPAPSDDDGDEGDSGNDDVAGGDDADANAAAGSDGDEADDEPEPTPEPTPTPEPELVGGDVTVAYTGEQVSLEGEVTTAEGRDALVRAAERLVGNGNVVDDLTVTDGDGSDLERVSVAVATIRRLGEWYETADLDLDGATMTIDGVLAPNGNADRAEQVVAQLTERVGIDATVNSLPAVNDDDPPADDDDTADEEPAEDDAADSEDATGEGDADDAAAVVESLDLGDVNFEVGTATLTPQALGSLDGIAAQLIDVSGVLIEVQGHTDASGDPDVNLLLSEERAIAVRDYLVGSGVDPSILTPRGYGAAQPIADNATDEGQAANRRVELVVIEGNN